MRKIVALCVVAACMVAGGCYNNAVVQTEAQAFITRYTDGSQGLQDSVMAAKWDAAVHIIPLDSNAALRIEKAELALAQFTGNQKNIEQAKKFLALKDQLTEIQVKELEMVLHDGALTPGSLPAVVRERIHEEAMQRILWGGYYLFGGNAVVTGTDLDAVLDSSTDIDARTVAWKRATYLGEDLAPGLLRLRDLRNQCVRSGGYTDYFNYKASEYGMSTKQLMPVLDGYTRDLWPLYRELHTWLRYELAKEYNCAVVPDYLPAHWLPADLGANGISMPVAEDSFLSRSLAGKDIFTEAVNGYSGMGFSPLPEGVYKKSSLQPFPADSVVGKMGGASFWNMDMGQDLRLIMSVQPTAYWWAAAHGQLGYVYYAWVLVGNNVRVMLRAGANRAFPKAMGELMAMQSMRPGYLRSCGLRSGEDASHELLREALHCVPAVLYAAGTAGHFEQEFYEDSLGGERFNGRWWELAKRYQGVVSPADEAGSKDAAAQHVLSDSPGASYDAAMSYVLLFQLQRHIADKVLHQDVHVANYAGSKAVGDYLQGIMKIGATRDWREVVKEQTGDTLSSKAMVAYFEPLMRYLKEENKGRTYTLPETLD